MLTSDYIEQNLSICNFSGSDSWVVLSPIEQRIKEKIERIGTPLKDWDINIYRGVLTGYNEAFIISGTQKDELIAKDPKSAEIIRPILRGRDIKRYYYEFADLYLIATFPSRKYDIEQYPAVKEHLLGFGLERLEQSGKPGARKKTNNKWFETQDSINYWDDFNKQKIIYSDITDKLSFCICNKEFFCNNTVYFMIANNDDKLNYLIRYLNSNIIDWYYKTLSVQLGEKAVRLFSIYVLNIPIPLNGTENIYESYELTKEEVDFIESIPCN